MDTGELGTAAGEIKYSEVVEATLAPSRMSAWFVGLSGAATLTLVLAMPWTLPWKAGIALALATSMLEWRLRARVASLRVEGKQLTVIDARGRQRTGAVREGSFVAPWLTVVRWRPEGAWFDRSLLVLPDMIGAAQFRRLRVLLKWA